MVGVEPTACTHTGFTDRSLDRQDTPSRLASPNEESNPDLAHTKGVFSPESLLGHCSASVRTDLEPPARS